MLWRRDLERRGGRLNDRRRSSRDGGSRAVFDVRRTAGDSDADGGRESRGESRVGHVSRSLFFRAVGDDRGGRAVGRVDCGADSDGGVLGRADWDCSVGSRVGCWLGRLSRLAWFLWFSGFSRLRWLGRLRRLLRFCGLCGLGRILGRLLRLGRLAGFFSWLLGLSWLAGIL